MEPLFENRMDFTKEVMASAYKQYFRRKQKVLNVILLVAAAMCAVIGVLAVVQGQGPIALLALAVAAALVYAALFSHSAHISRALKQDKDGRMFGEKTVRVYEDKVELGSAKDGARADYPHKAITGCWNAEGMYILEYGSLIVVLGKGDFTKGSPQAFEAFMQQALPARLRRT